VASFTPQPLYPWINRLGGPWSRVGLNGDDKNLALAANLSAAVLPAPVTIPTELS
jgi:hypothetical protein